MFPTTAHPARLAHAFPALGTSYTVRASLAQALTDELDAIAAMGWTAAIIHQDDDRGEIDLLVYDRFDRPFRVVKIRAQRKRGFRPRPIAAMPAPKPEPVSVRPSRAHLFAA